MQNADIAIGVLAVVAVLGSILGIALYDAPDDLTWDVTYPTSTHDVGEQVLQTTLAGSGAEDSETWDLETMNVTAARFGLQLSGTSPARAQAVTVEYTIEAPNGVSETETLTLAPGAGGAATGTLTVELGLPADLPSTVNASSREGAIEQIPEGLDGTGNWTIMVRITQAGGLPIVGQPESVTVTVIAERYTSYTANVQAQTPDLSPAA